jgi:acetyltransferase-like isoleucine patch superfamily enzyme
MKQKEQITGNQYVEVEYHQFSPSRALTVAMKVAGILTWPIIWPLALLARTSDFIFRTVSELLSIAPYLIGTILRQEFYRWTLTDCGNNVSIGFGTIFVYRDVKIGSHVTVGTHVTIHHCNIGSYVLIADACQLLSGSRYHNFDCTDIPMALQGGKLRRITIADDCWIGAGAIVMNDVGTGSVVGAGAIVNRFVEPYSVVAGNPAQLIRRRK